MILVITPLVQEATQPRIWWRMVCYAGALIASSVGVGFILGAVGALASVPNDGMEAMVGSAALLIAAREFGIVRTPLPSLNRLVPREWLRLGLYRGAILYGAVVGLGFVTRAPYGSYHVLLMLQFLTADPAYGATLGAIYGVARAVPVLVAILPDRRDVEPRRLGSKAGTLLTRDGYVHLVNALVLSICGSLLAATVALSA